MLGRNLVELLQEHHDANVVLKYGYHNYPIQNVFTEKGIIMLRCFKLLTRDEKINCDVSYADEEIELTAKDLIDKLNPIMDMSEYIGENNLLVQLSVPDGEYNIVCEYDETENIFVFGIEGEDDE